jgi:hypothetical protein
LRGVGNCPIYTGLLKKKNLLGEMNNRPILHFLMGGLKIAGLLKKKFAGGNEKSPDPAFFNGG